MPIPFYISKFVDDLTATMVVDILESCSPAEIKRLIEELELRVRKPRLH
jgi:hypothetical protein